MTQRPSGWYDDPEDPDQLRYWDGILWSPRRMPKVKPGLEQSGLSAPGAAQNNHLQERSAPGMQPRQQDNQWRTTQAPGAGSKVAVTPDGSQLAGWWQRAVAIIIDYLLISTLGALVALPWTLEWVRHYQAFVSDWGLSGPMPALPADVANVPWQIGIANLVLYAIYEIGLTVWRGQTVGKIATGIRVRPAASPGRPDLRAATIRFVLKCATVVFGPVAALGALAIFFSILDYLWPLRNAQRRAIHDLAAETCVVRTRGTHH